MRKNICNLLHTELCFVGSKNCFQLVQSLEFVHSEYGVDWLHGEEVVLGDLLGLQLESVGPQHGCQHQLELQLGKILADAVSLGRRCPSAAASPPRGHLPPSDREETSRDPNITQDRAASITMTTKMKKMNVGVLALATIDDTWMSAVRKRG